TKTRATVNKSARQPDIIPFHKHELAHHDISDAAVRVIETLRKHAYEAYLVGGSVRDLLLGLHPKDFDVATNATPEQVTRLFRNAMIIGRRFKIVHVRFGRDMIEVTTFRGHHHEQGVDPAQVTRERSKTEGHRAQR